MLDDRIPAAFIVDQIAVARGIHNVQAELDAVLHDHCARTSVWVVINISLTHRG